MEINNRLKEVIRVRGVAKHFMAGVIGVSVFLGEATNASAGYEAPSISARRITLGEVFSSVSGSDRAPGITPDGDLTGSDEFNQGAEEGSAYGNCDEQYVESSEKRQEIIQASCSCAGYESDDAVK